MNFKHVFCATLALLAPMFFSCHGKVTIRPNSDGTANYAVSIDIGPVAESVLKSASGGNSEQALLNKDLIEENLRSIGCTNIIVQIVPPSSKGGSHTVRFTFRAPLKTEPDSLVLSSRGGKSLSVNLSPKKIQGWVEGLPQEMRSYVDLLMAPVVEGETMSVSEYVDLVAAVYGPALSKEISGAQVGLSIIPPAKSRQKDFSVPLTEILTLKGPKKFSADW